MSRFSDSTAAEFLETLGGQTIKLRLAHPDSKHPNSRGFHLVGLWAERRHATFESQITMETWR
jgi:hypothetical protein